MLLITVVLVYLAALLSVACGRGERATVPTWFDLIQSRVNPTNRASRRAR